MLRPVTRFDIYLYFTLVSRILSSLFQYLNKILLAFGNGRCVPPPPVIPDCDVAETDLD